MKTVLVISSFVAASRVGASASSFCLRRLGVETVTLPTTLLGRHPGWGEPGGSAVDAFTLESMWQGIQAQNIKFDAVLTGYMASPAQVVLAHDIVKAVKDDNPEAVILVDPVMGDDGRLYIDEAAAQGIRENLIPLANLITPNVWELGYLTGKPTNNPSAIFAAANDMNCGVIVTSVPDGENIGAAYVHRGRAALVSHTQFDRIPHGGGDALAATLLGNILNGMSTEDALAKSVSAIFDIISTAIDRDSGELPLIRRQEALDSAPPLPLQRFTL